MSFDPDSMAAMRRLLPRVPRGLIADRFAEPDWDPLPPLRRFALRHLLGTAAVTPAFISYGVHDLPAPAPSILRAFGMPIITWTVRTVEDRAKAMRYADQITFEGFDPDAA
jgi:glycerophosphoryl diester phosphodiesterase